MKWTTETESELLRLADDDSYREETLGASACCQALVCVMSILFVVRMGVGWRADSWAARKGCWL